MRCLETRRQGDSYIYFMFFLRVLEATPPRPPMIRTREEQEQRNKTGTVEKVPTTVTVTTPTRSSRGTPAVAVYERASGEHGQVPGCSPVDPALQTSSHRRHLPRYRLVTCSVTAPSPPLHLFHCSPVTGLFTCRITGVSPASSQLRYLPQYRPITCLVTIASQSCHSPRHRLGLGHE